MSETEKQEFDPDEINRLLNEAAYDELPLEYFDGEAQFTPLGGTPVSSDDSLFAGLEVEGPESFRSNFGDESGPPELFSDALPEPPAPKFKISELEQALEHYFGFSEFREGQKEVISAVLEGQDVLAIMPTSAGKSLLYQLPALLLPGVTLVISPLISLMKDQVDKLVEKGIAASFINSSLSEDERKQRFEAAKRGEIKILFVAPERFRSRVFKRTVQKLNVSLFAVDEAHCVSSWGHDFRPDYLKLRRAIDHCGRPPVLAVTATATDNVRQDIETHLGFGENYFRLIAGFDRPNLRFTVTQVATAEEKISILANLTEKVKGACIIYCSTRKNTEKVTDSLANLGVKVAGYHAGLDSDTRRQVQEYFMEGKIRVVCATNAFGMGIDKNDVRLVAHYDLPGSIEAYYQEAGRAGRDAKPSECILLFRPGDIYIQEFLIDMSYPTRSVIEQTYSELLKLDDGRHEITLNQLSRRIPEAKSDRTIGAALRLLDEAEHIDRGGRLDNPARIRQLRDPKKGSRANAQNLFGRLIKLYGERLKVGISLTLPELSYQVNAGVDQLRKLLPELRRDGYIEYFAPFTGRSVTVLYPQVTIPQLKVDFNAVEEQRGRDRDRLQKTIDYAYSPTCRRAYILKYFGAPSQASCGNCDICAPTDPTQQARALTDGELITLKKLLSCVVRMKGRYGRGKVVSVLRGSKARDIVDKGLHRLSTHGLLSDWEQGALNKLILECQKRGLVEETRDDSGRYPKIQITQMGRDVVFDRVRVNLVFPGARTSSKRQTAQYKKHQASRNSTPQDEELFQALRKWRSDVATQKKLKPFMVFPDRTLRAIAEARPKSRAQLLSLPGIGEAKLKKFGKKILDFITNYDA